MPSLKGNNQIKKFRQIANRLVAKMLTQEGIVGIIFAGALVRGFADKYSDVDITALVRGGDNNLRRKLRKIGLDEQKRSGIDVDLEVHFFDEFRRRSWDEIHMWDFSQAKVVYDPKDETRHIIREKLKVPKSYWTRRIVIYGEMIRWYCCPSEKDVGTVAESWIVRGDLISAHYCLNYAIDLVLRVIFALNKTFFPPQKWAVYYSYRLNWLPRNYKKSMKEAMTARSTTEADLIRRLKALKRLWSSVLPKMKEKTGLTPRLISKYYVEKVLHQA